MCLLRPSRGSAQATEEEGASTAICIKFGIFVPWIGHLLRISRTSAAETWQRAARALRVVGTAVCLLASDLPGAFVEALGLIAYHAMIVT